MKAISLWQPWASLVILGLKQYETRSWQTSYRGTLVIHAGKEWNEELDRLWNRFQIRIGQRFDAPRGVALGTVELMDVLPTDPIAPNQIGNLEWLLGDYRAGRYAWKLANPIVFPDPIPCQGHQRLWEVE